MASEDSDEIVPGLLPIHGLSDLRDLDETVCRQMAARGDELHAASELLEVLLLGTQHRMLPEERDDRLQEIRSPSHRVSKHVLPMIVVSTVRGQISNTEELTKRFEARDARGALRNRELVRDLEAGPVAAPARPALLPDEPDREASFSVYKTHYPATELNQSFLLVFRTGHVVTMVNVTADVTR
jgi:hypothetical protein